MWWKRILSGFLLSASALATPTPAPTGYLLSGMPLIRQTYNNCGPAALTQVLGYYGVTTTQKAVSQLTRPSETAYMSAQAIINFAPQIGFRARLYVGGSVNSVRKAIANRIPLVVLQEYHAPNGKIIPHWRVVSGFDDAQQRIYLHDPLLGYVSMTYVDFNLVWTPKRGQFAVLYPPEWEKLINAVLG